MHREMKESEGVFDAAKPVDVACRKCGRTGAVTVRTWESSDGAYEDEKYTCECGHYWWVEGADA